MAKAISTLNDVKKLVTEFVGKNPHLLERDGKMINTILALQNKYGITSYHRDFDDDTEALYSYEDKKIITGHRISKKKERLYRAICLAHNIFAEANGEKPSSFLYKKGDPIYSNTEEKIIFDIATELLIVDKNFKNIAMQYGLDIKQLDEAYETTQAVVLNKLSLNDLNF
jgi:hypothetical protein